MNPRVREFIQVAARDVVGLDAALFYQANPRTFDTSAGLALRLHRSAQEIEPALERLAEYGLLEKVTRGDGRYQVYSLSRDPKMWSLLCLVSETYLDDPESRKEIVRMLIQHQREARAQRAEEE